MSSKDSVKFKSQKSKLWNRSAITFINFALSFCILIFAFYITKNFALAPTFETNTPNQPASPKITTVLAVGDIMLSRNVSTKIEQAKNPNLPFEKLQDQLKSADITFGNLECPLSPLEKPSGQGLVFRCPGKYVSGLVNAGFDVLSTANNHSLDQGLDDLEFTTEYLRSQNILPVGTGASYADAHSVQITEKNGIRFGFLATSYTARNDGGKSRQPQIADMDPLVIKEYIQYLKESHAADIIIVSMHAGTEYTRHPNQQQIDFAHAAIDAGANIVIGHHPHWIQAIEEYSPTADPFPASGEGAPVLGRGEGKRKGLIFYSLGNFVFDQMWSQETREGLMVRLNFKDTELQNYELIPVIIDNYCCPRQATKEEAQKILKKNNLDFDGCISSHTSCTL